MAPAKFALFIAAASAIALPAHGAKAFSPAAGAPKENAAGSSPVHQIHGCYYSCECGPPKDFGCEQQYHRHLHMLCLPVRCASGPACERTPPEGACRHVTPR